MTPVEDELNSHKEFLDTFFGSDDEGGRSQVVIMTAIILISLYRSKSIAH